jgi:hypothetical protein
MTFDVTWEIAFVAMRSLVTRSELPKALDALEGRALERARTFTENVAALPRTDRARTLATVFASVQRTVDGLAPR